MKVWKVERDSMMTNRLFCSLLLYGLGCSVKGPFVPRELNGFFVEGERGFDSYSWSVCKSIGLCEILCGCVRMCWVSSLGWNLGCWKSTED